jgi:hypothetical protein
MYMKNGQRTTAVRLSTLAEAENVILLSLFCFFCCFETISSFTNLHHHERCYAYGVVCNDGSYLEPAVAFLSAADQSDSNGCTTEQQQQHQQQQNNRLVFSAPNADMNMSNKTKITACQNFLLDGGSNLAQEGQERSTTTNGRLLDSFLVAIARSIILIFLLFVRAFYIEDDVSKRWKNFL